MARNAAKIKFCGITNALDAERAVGAGGKEWISFAFYVASVPAAFVSPYISIAIYVGISILWVVPDRRFTPQHDGAGGET